MKSQASATVIQQRIVPLPERDEHFPIVGKRGDGNVKTRRNYTHDDVALPVEDDRLPKNVRVRTKFAPPQAFSKKSDGSSPNLILARNKGAPGEGLHPQQRKHIRGDELSLHLLGFTSTGQAERVAAIDRERRKGVILFLPIAKIRIRDRAVLKVWLALAESDQLVCLRERQRIQQHPVDHGKQRRVGTDAQGQCQYSNSHEAGILPKHPQPVSQVLPGGLQHHSYLSAMMGSTRVAARAGI